RFTLFCVSVRLTGAVVLTFRSASRQLLSSERQNQNRTSSIELLVSVCFRRSHESVQQGDASVGSGTLATTRPATVSPALSWDNGADALSWPDGSRYSGSRASGSERSAACSRSRPAAPSRPPAAGPAAAAKRSPPAGACSSHLSLIGRTGRAGGLHFAAGPTIS